MKRISPYNRLRDTARDFISKFFTAERRGLWTFEKDALENKTWSLRTLKARVDTAKKLGWSTVIESTDTGLAIVFVRLPTETDVPWEFRS